MYTFSHTRTHTHTHTQEMEPGHRVSNLVRVGSGHGSKPWHAHTHARTYTSNENSISVIHSLFTWWR